MTASPGPVLIVDPEAQWLAERLAGSFPDLPIRWARRFDEAEAHLAQARVLVTMGVAMDGLELTRDVVAKLPRLEWVQCLLAGYGHIVAALDQRRDVILTTVSGIHGPQMAETVLLHMLMLARGVKRQVANQTARRWQPSAQALLSGRQVGIVGLGASGREIARTCKALGMIVHGISRQPGPIDGVDHLTDRSHLPQVAGSVDFLVLALAAEPGTEQLINKAILDAMKPTACLINVSRGSVVDEPALINALTQGEIAGVGLDVFAVEPLPADSPLWMLDTVVITPHIAGRSDRYAEQTLAVVEPNLRAYQDGDLSRLINAVTR
jgi:D-2-hydroxyacid dehydrogenase (NADP+)